MATTVNASHDIRSLILDEHRGPTKRQSLRFIRQFETTHGASIETKGTKEQLVDRITEKMTLYEDEDDVAKWEGAYETWFGVTLAQFS
ncbi:hypothetical protein B0H16DRAFT_1894177 [Mycena metata]|uniref:Uncharacterized protein n=1 Tax=Mycena metata TaxID=1033252 RepID=A0AAD7HVR6_9AGAR|nr:hypothetical protein B0H16DRAFT_1894177 [Mycena metata]